ncbi:MAG TPA: hypothetical protein VGL22_06200 [Terracidiphilus sp.]|jgi:hypothetical protein
MHWRKLSIWIAVIACAAVLATVIALRVHRWRPRTVTLQGAVLRQDPDPGQRLPISGVKVEATDGMMSASAKSDASGYFKLTFRERLWPGHTLQLSFRKSDYEDFDLSVPMTYAGAGDKLYIAALSPLRTEHETENATGKKAAVVSNIRIRFTENTEGDENIGSAVRTFQAVNKANVPCNQQAPCSPDGKWKAAVASTTLDAGTGNEFRNARASCIAGPCPFTRIDSSGFENGGRMITASALNWSDTATFLLEAEVFRKSINSSVRESYPVKFGRTLNFVLPATQEGVSIEADIDGTPIVFPLGPDMYLSWATCNSRSSRDAASSTVYRCELKPGFRF